jgi:hypothetical protein
MGAGTGEWSSLDLTGPTLVTSAATLVEWSERIEAGILDANGVGRPTRGETGRAFDQRVSDRAVSMAVRLHNGVTKAMNSSKEQDSGEPAQE